MSLYASALDAIGSWRPADADQEELRQTYLRHLREHPDGLARECVPDHITGSAVVVSDDRSRVLLNLHRRYEIWVQFGGHLEADDPSLAAGALRETIEESGIADLEILGGIAQLDTHEVRCGPLRPSHHLDVRFVALAPPGALPTVSSESLDVRWFDVGSLPIGLESAVRDLVEIAVAR